MTNRRVFLGGAMAAAAVACAGLGGRARAGPGPTALVPFYPLATGRGPTFAAGRAFDDAAAAVGEPTAVELGRLDVGHFYGLSHEGGGRIAYLYHATLDGPGPRAGLVKLDGCRSLSST